METNKQEPLLSHTNDVVVVDEEGNDIHYIRQFVVESKKLWYLAGPAIFTTVCQYALGATTQTFAGHFGTLHLAAFSIMNSVIGGLSFGIMLGMGSALETLCGQAYGGGHIEMLGVYMQRSWIILLLTAFLLMFLYIFAFPFLLLIGQTEDISRASGKFALWMIPQLYAYAFNFPIAKFLQSQSKIMAMAWISAATLVLHVLFSWLVMFRLGWGMTAGLVVLNVSWWFIVVAQLVYIFSGACGKAWSGFSWKAFENLGSFVRLSLESALMMCLETWYFMALVLLAGYMKNAEVAVDAMSICTNILGLTIMVALGFNAAIRMKMSVLPTYSMIGLREHIKKRPPLATTEKVQQIVRAKGKEAIVAGFYHGGYEESLLMLMRRRGVHSGLVVKGEEGALSMTTRLRSPSASKGLPVNYCSGFRSLSETSSQAVDGVSRESFNIVVNAKDYGFEPTDTPRTDRSVTRNIELGLAALRGEKGPTYDRIVLNAGMVDHLLGCDGAQDITSALDRAREAIDSGRALNRLLNYIKISNKVT
ncbi:hypothetical protein RD792_004600 [Penstemon davidsonii]|uniref:Protein DETOXIFICATION n=1 Tax=Penstemon davidsonii TaxID=160366 RepID=A0ABR0DHS3_9LAMI|nr:hypothetical protein RD792_004600 [Penstemon davidsonii]